MKQKQAKGGKQQWTKQREETGSKGVNNVWEQMWLISKTNRCNWRQRWPMKTGDKQEQIQMKMQEIPQN